MLFRIGQHVVCISEDFSRAPYWRSVAVELPRLKRIYTVRGICQSADLMGLYFEEITNPSGHFAEGYVEPAFNSRNFRPVKDTSIEVFRKLLAPKEEGVGEEVRRRELVPAE